MTCETRKNVKNKADSSTSFCSNCHPTHVCNCIGCCKRCGMCRTSPWHARACDRIAALNGQIKAVIQEVTGE